MTTRLGFCMILAGITLLVLRVIGTVDTELADILSVLAIVIGALGVAIDGDRPVARAEPETKAAAAPAVAAPATDVPAADVVVVTEPVGPAPDGTLAAAASDS